MPRWGRADRGQGPGPGQGSGKTGGGGHGEREGGWGSKQEEEQKQVLLSQEWEELKGRLGTTEGLTDEQLAVKIQVGIIAEV